MSDLLRPRLVRVLLLLALVLGGYFRSSGLFRGLNDGVVFHPDAPKQVMMLGNYLHGNYVQYYDSLFYDGYPYGLNRVDEALIRAAQRVVRPLRENILQQGPLPWVPSRQELYAWGLVLRVFYGLLTTVLIYAAAARLSGSRGAALAAAALYAVAPLGSTVTHSVTGDVGVDLFLAAALYCAARYALNGFFPWLCGLSAACGAAFACKFQGLLGLWIGLPCFLMGLVGERRPWSALFRRAFAMAGAFVFAVLAMNPALLLEPSTSWKNLWANFSFIRNYGAPAEILAKPLSEQIAHGFSHNIPRVLESLGWALSALAALACVGLLLSVRKGFCRTPDEASGRAERRVFWVGLGLASFPWVALLLAGALKPAVQPFHFSFLLPPLAVAAGCGMVKRMSSFPLRLVSLGLLPLALCELAAASLREDFFWRRPEISSLAPRYAEAVFGEPRMGNSRRAEGRRVIKSFSVESSGLPVFRNRPSGLEHPRAEWWRRRVQLPVPSVPLPGDAHWIFVNGPVFPRSDRMIAVPASGPGLVDRPGPDGRPLATPVSNREGRWTRRTLVFADEPGEVVLGLRSGRWPVRYDIRLAGLMPRSGFLAPHSQTLVPLGRPSAVREFTAAEGRPSAHLVPLSLRSQLGPLWATVLTRPEEIAVFEYFGPGGGGEVAEAPDSISSDAVRRELAELRYVEGSDSIELDEEWRPLPGGQVPLAAGPYVFKARLINLGPETRVRLSREDASGFRSAEARHEALVAPGVQDVVWKFAKAFAPYDATLSAAADRPGVTVLSWTLRPDADAIAQWSPMAERLPEAEIPLASRLDVRYPGLGILRGLAIPEPPVADKPFDYAVRFDLDESIAHRTFHETAIFLHVKNANGEVVGHLDYPLRKASFVPRTINWRQGLPLPAGSYRIEGGLYNVRTRNRHPFEATPAQVEGHRRVVQLHAFTVAAAPPDAPPPER